MAQQLEIPFEYHDEKLGVKVKFLTTDRCCDDSLKLISYNALYKRMKSATQPEKELRRASLGFDALVEFNSLIQEWRDALVFKFGKPAEKVKESFFAKHYISDRKAFDFFAAHRYGEDNKKLEPEVIELYTYNASVLNTVLEVRNKRKMYAKSLGVTGQFDIWQSLSNDVNAFQQVSHDLPTTKDSLRHKVNRFTNEGYASIVSRKYGMRNAAKVKDDEQQAFIEELLNKHQNLNNEQVASFYNMAASIKSGWEPITAGVIAVLRKKLDMYVFSGQHGTTELMHRKHMQIKRSKPSSAMLFWSMDGWDAELLYQKTSINKKGQSVTTYHNRLTVVMILDPYNYYIIGYAIGHSESPTLIKQALSNAFKHTEKLFKSKYKPYQLQTDRYQYKHLKPTYEAAAKYFTPAQAKNSKSKPIEQFFDKFNEKHFQAKLVPNWSGHNVTAKGDNQVNDDYLNKIRHQFPDENGCRMQIIQAIENERSEKVQQYIESFNEFPNEDKTTMDISYFLRFFGETTGYTNKFDGEGLTPTILGIERAYDTFDLNFRKHMHEDWMVFYDVDDLRKVLVSNAKSQDGRLVEEIGNLEFLLEEKYIQPMSLYDQEKQDAIERQKVFDFNKNYNNEIMSRNESRHETLEDLFNNNPQLDTLRKLMITNSAGQHKDQKSTERLEHATKRISKKQAKQEQKVLEESWSASQEAYIKDKINTSKYFNS